MAPVKCRYQRHGGSPQRWLTLGTGNSQLAAPTIRQKNAGGNPRAEGPVWSLESTDGAPSTRDEPLRKYL